VPVYPAASAAAAAAVIVLELAVLRTGIFRMPAYWVAMFVSYAFMVPVDGWLTKLSAPIVLYRDGDTSGLRPVWDILAEELLYAFALLTLVIALWDTAPMRLPSWPPETVEGSGTGASGGRGRVPTELCCACAARDWALCAP
jgi:lycopene cyclase domain-containing protein